MNQTSFPFQPSRFASLRATTPVPVSWETIVNELTGPFHKAQTELYGRQLLVCTKRNKTTIICFSRS